MSGVILVKLQQTPRAVTIAPPSLVIFPPLPATPGSALETVGTVVVSVGIALDTKLT